MSGLGVLGFASPWLLLGLVALPVIWWLVRVTPPAPRKLDFPALRLLLGLDPREESADRTPWWLVLLRLAVAGLVVVGLAGPVLNPVRIGGGTGPLLLVIDDGWAAAATWPARLAAVAPYVQAAIDAERPIRLLTTAPTDDAVTPPPLIPGRDLAGRLAALMPQPWAVDRGAAARAVDALPAGAVTETLWLSDDVADPGATLFAERLARLGPVTRLVLPPGRAPLVLTPPDAVADGLTIGAARPLGDGPRQLAVAARSDSGALVATADLVFGATDHRASATVRLPVEARNQIARVELVGEDSAGATWLLDSRWQRRTVGIAGDSDRDQGRPLVSGSFYLDRAMQPFAALREAPLDQLLAATPPPDVIILADIAQVAPALRPTLEDWLDKGGVLLRFAGPRFAANPDDLVPVTLRRGDRTLGGALSWTEPAAIAPFPADSPLAGLVAPPDVRIFRQVLAEPSVELDRRTWARLADGTPLITAAKRGGGLLILVHTTANGDWSNLALSGLFVDLLRRIVALAKGGGGAAEEVSLPPLASLDGFGRIGPARAGSLAVSSRAIDTTAATPRHPPGYYGDRSARRALNLAVVPDTLVPLPGFSGVRVEIPQSGAETPLGPWAITFALLLGLIDLAVALLLSGRLTRVAALVLGGLLVAAPLTGARAAPLSPAEAAAQIRLGYVVTGDFAVDEMSEAGLKGLSLALTSRTSVEPADPVPVNLEADELAFLPLLYWPMTPGYAPSAAALARLDGYVQAGGVVLFDTRDGDLGDGAPNLVAGPGAEALQRVLAGMDVPPLVPVPADHVLTRAFYLLQQFPGRHDSGTLWVEATARPDTDGVSSYIIGANDWASAWAVDPTGRPIAALDGGGVRQRELALRFGINLVMYALTGNYKADQVHVPALLERLGQ